MLLLAGDLATSLDVIEQSLKVVKTMYDEVAFVVGNHELWVSGRVGDSMAKLAQIDAACARFGVRIRPFALQDDAGRRVVVLPLLSWYHASWDREADLPGRAGGELMEASWMDFGMCRWPEAVCGPGDEWRRLGSRSAGIAEAFPAADEP